MRSKALLGTLDGTVGRIGWSGFRVAVSLVAVALVLGATSPAAFTLAPMPPNGDELPKVLDQDKLYRGIAGLVGASAPDPLDRLGSAITVLGDLDGDGVDDLAVGAPLHDDGIPAGGGGVWVLFLNPDGSVRAFQAVTALLGGGPVVSPFDSFGAALAGLGDLDGDGVPDLAVGAPGDDDGGSAAGAVWILFLNADGSVREHQKISSWAGGFGGTLLGGDAFGSSLAVPGDLDGNGAVELCVGTPGVDLAGTSTGAVWTLFLLPDGTVRDEVRLDGFTSPLAGEIELGDLFGSALAGPGDLDGDGVVDLVVGAEGDERSGLGFGAVFVLFLNADGTARDLQPITAGEGGFAPDGIPLGAFGAGLAALGDVNDDGFAELAVGDPEHVEGALAGATKGAAWIVSLLADGTVGAQQKLSAGSGNLGPIPDGTGFASALAGRAPNGDGLDLDDNGKPDLLVGAPFDSDGGSFAGAVHVLALGEGAAVRARNAGTNPASLTADDPVLGQTWTVQVDVTTTGHLFAQILGYATPLSLALPGGQTLLMNVLDPGGDQLVQPILQGPLVTFRLPVPNDPALCGLCLSVQAVHVLGTAPFALSNALDIVVGL